MKNFINSSFFIKYSFRFNTVRATNACLCGYLGYLYFLNCN